MGGQPHGGSPRVVDVLAATLRRLSPLARRRIQYVLVAYVAVLLLQVWDSRNNPNGPIAEFASVALGAGGFLLLGLAHLLRTIRDPAETAGDATIVTELPPPDPDAPAVRQILLAVPVVAAVAAILLAGAVVFLISRVWLGASAIHLAMAGVYVIAISAALYIVKDAAAQLYLHAQEQALRAGRMQAQLADARLSALQAKMNPHFLFNALNTVASLARSNPAAAEQTVLNLSQVLRTTLERSQEPRTTLRSELELVRSYLGVEAERFGSRLRVVYDVADGVEGLSVPSFSLQPLVENSLKHGLGPRRDGGTVRIFACVDASRLQLGVDDDGEGFGARHVEGTGLGNLRARLEAMYGDTASLQIRQHGPGARVTISLPAQVKERGDARADR
jgi:sensor histidine kinase YesM